MGPRAVITDESRTERVASTLPAELSYISIEILDTEAERTETMREYNSKLKKLKKRLRDVATAIKSGGMQLTLDMFPETKAVLEGGDGGDKDTSDEEE